MVLKLASDKIKLEDNASAVNDFFYERGWTDGLPIIPPTQDAVEKMLAGTRRSPQEVVAILAPKSGVATVEKIAINAVMAGCLPEYMPVILATVEAMADDKFNLLGTQVTTHPAAPLIIVNGPLAKKLKMNSRGNAFQPGVRSNAAIGRAIRLILLNIGGGIPIHVDKATMGGPAKYTFCVAENEEQSPWTPLHVERGFKPDDSTVTVFSAESPHNINDHSSITGKGILMTCAATMATAGNNNTTYFRGEAILIMGPEHAATVVKDGFTKEQVKDFIFEHARLPLKMLSEENIHFRRTSTYDYGKFADSETIPVCKREDIVVMVLGGEGKHSMFVPTFAMSYSATRLIKE